MPIQGLNHVVALGGGHGLGRVMSALSFLGPRLTGIVTTTDNGGSTGRIREAEGGIAWGDIRNCINQMITEPTTASTMFEYRFNGNGELSGHNLGNLMLKALDNLSVRPLDAINLIRDMLKVNSYLIPMTEHPTDLVAINHLGHLTHGEVNIDQLEQMPKKLMLDPVVHCTKEAFEIIDKAELIIIGPGSFMTSLLPPLLLPEIKEALKQTQAPIIYIDNLGKEHSAAGLLSLQDKLAWLEETIGQREVNAAIVSPSHTENKIKNTLIVPYNLAAKDISYRHDRILLKQALDLALSKLN